MPSQFQSNIDKYDKEAFGKMQHVQRLHQDMNDTLTQQKEEERERRVLELADRSAKTITTLPVLEKSNANHGTDPVMGLGEVLTSKEKRQRRKMKAVLSENIKQRVCGERGS